MTNEIVNLISKYSPTDLERLRDSLPDGFSLQPGKLLGDSNIKTLSITNEVQLALTGLKLADELCKKCVPLLARRLHTSRILQLGSQIVAAVSSISLLGTLASTSQFVKYFLAGLTAAASIIGIVAQWLITSLNPTVSDLSSAYGKIIDDRFEVSRLSGILSSGRSPDDDAALKDAVDQSNVICRDVNVLSSAVGVA